MVEVQVKTGNDRFALAAEVYRLKLFEHFSLITLNENLFDIQMFVLISFQALIDESIITPHATSCTCAACCDDDSSNYTLNMDKFR